MENSSQYLVYTARVYNFYPTMILDSLLEAKVIYVTEIGLYVYLGNNCF